MSTGELIAAIAVFIMAGALSVLSALHFMERGPLLNNAYLYASAKERQAMDKKPYYRQSAVVLCLLGLVFTVIGLSVILHEPRLYLLEAVLVIAAAVYAVASSVRIHQKK